MMPQVEITASKLALSNGSRSASPSWYSMPSPCAAAFAWAAASLNAAFETSLEHPDDAKRLREDIRAPRASLLNGHAGTNDSEQ
jgi:hypothetical protein